MIGQNSLNNFYQSVKFQNPALAHQIFPDVRMVAVHALASDKSGGKDAADRLRLMALDLPVVFGRVLENALIDLGY
jgi:hypothetical protein